MRVQLALVGVLSALLSAITGVVVAVVQAKASATSEAKPAAEAAAKPAVAAEARRQLRTQSGTVEFGGKASTISWETDWPPEKTGIPGATFLRASRRIVQGFKGVPDDFEITVFPTDFDLAAVGGNARLSVSYASDPNTGLLTVYLMTWGAPEPQVRWAKVGWLAIPREASQTP